MKTVHCRKCGKKVENEEIALTMKLLGKQVPFILCYQCLSDVLFCEENELRERAVFFRSMGCELFKTDYIGRTERVEK